MLPPLPGLPAGLAQGERPDTPPPVGGLPVVGMVGAGQLARMTHQAAIALGIGFRVLAETPADSAAQVCGDVTVGDYTSYADLAAFASRCDVVTFDHEHVPLEHVRRLAAEGVVVRPGPQAFPFVQDKILMRRRLAELGAPVPAWTSAESVSEIEVFARIHGWPVVAKTASGGYDGKGVWVLRSTAEAAALASHVDEAGLALFVEAFVPFRRELAVLVARSASGESRTWPVVETVQRDGICTQVLAPAPGIDPTLSAEAQALAAQLAKDLDVVGLLAVELFETPDTRRRLVVNELAMRPHNSGHWTIDGSRTSQFEQHLRAVLGWPLGETTAIAPYSVMVNLLGGSGPEAAELGQRLPTVLAADPGAHLHLYGKAIKPGRKIGHITVVGDDWHAARRRAERATELLRGAGDGA